MRENQRLASLTSARSGDRPDSPAGMTGKEAPGGRCRLSLRLSPLNSALSAGGASVRDGGRQSGCLRRRARGRGGASLRRLQAAGRALGAAAPDEDPLLLAGMARKFSGSQCVLYN
jgi:hypothetical protein